MAASTAGAVKAYVETLALGVAVFRDRPPVGQAYPFVTITDELSLTVRQDTGTGSELVQVDLWQQLRWPAGHPLQGKVAEDPQLARALQRGLLRFPLDTAPTLTYRGALEGSVRLPDPDGNVVHHALTVRVAREL